MKKTTGGGKLTHVDSKGRARMVDVGAKPVCLREAEAAAEVKMRPDVLKAAMAGTVPKGEVIATARVAGIQAAKRTPDLIPMCHPLRIDSVTVDFEPDMKKGMLKISARVRATDRTGVEMEALTAAATAALTVYDMCKAVQKDMIIGNVRLVKKTKTEI